MEIDFADIELHDARLISVSADYRRCKVVVLIEYYPTSNASSRVPATIRFDGVTHFNEIIDLEDLQSNAAAGNISYWIPSEGSGTTYIHLARGLISIAASTLVFVSDA